MKLKIEISLDNAAFADAPHTETRTMLSDVAEAVCDAQAWHYGGIDSGSVMDSNGQKVGTWAIDFES